MAKRKNQLARAPGTPEEPEHYDDAGRLTYHGAKAAIEAGGSVLLAGHDEPITSIDDLPTEAEMALGNAEREEQVGKALDGQIAALAAQRAKLTDGSPEKKELEKKELEKLRAQAEKEKAQRETARQTEEATKGQGVPAQELRRSER